MRWKTRSPLTSQMAEGTRDVERDHRTEQNPAAADAVKV
jgi:hypothetical protein